MKDGMNDTRRGASLGSNPNWGKGEVTEKFQLRGWKNMVPLRKNGKSGKRLFFYCYVEVRYGGRNVEINS